MRPLVAQDFPELRRWFADPELDEQLGPLDEEWLRHVLADDSGAQFSFVRDAQLVGVAGVVWRGAP
ncbi:GNAT family N-acetyltransferase [Chitiniphilus purpureus]|uniref:GNAT family N-acetyltransferase n=1 Tax=Chitiniphilus purpureus TaxID=2981137 RepID=A0ABY6DR90_9NEIS|nr:GNAT family N-acetyltransferase [Chitiniphilus sp. CD1]UXY16889.1 GNAT family N-acetyltransferase [Chitiniphilus sp. CD1]